MILLANFSRLAPAESPVLWGFVLTAGVKSAGGG